MLAIAAKRVGSKLASTTIVVGLTTGAGSGVTTGVGVAAGFGFAATFTPLFQTSLFPDLTQVYLIPLMVLV